ALWARLLPQPGTSVETRPVLSCLAVSHRRRALERADQIIVLKDGYVTGVGPLAELLTSNQELQHLWQQQIVQ
ncbi:MAG: hypothetical protein KDE53_24030, partial [Caldilineaceae bacterium]|nr:hypothetical protein [Caldilineaceae bacterium]